MQALPKTLLTCVPVLLLVALSSRTPTAQAQQQNNDCFEQVCAAFGYNQVIGNSSIPPDVSLVLQHTDVDGEGTNQCATCPEKECKYILDIDFSSSSNNWMLVINGRAPQASYNDAIVMRANCKTDSGYVTTFHICWYTDPTIQPYQYKAGVNCHCEVQPE